MYCVILFCCIKKNNRACDDNFQIKRPMLLLDKC